MLPIITVAALDPVVRDRGLFHLQLGLSGCVVLRYELTSVPGTEQGTLRRVISDDAGVVEDHTDVLEHSCLHCATRLDIVPTLHRLIDAGCYAAVVLSLPLSANPDSIMEELDHAVGEGLQARLCPLVTLVDPGAVAGDVFGDDLLHERGLELSDADDRAVGETWCQQVEGADVVVSVDRPEPESLALVSALAASDADVVAELDRLDPSAILARTYDRPRAVFRTHPVTWSSPRSCPEAGIYTLELTSARPFHPERLYDQIELLGTGAIRSRGCFWLPTRPAAVCAWDGSGGQLSIGDAARWPDRTRVTRLCFVSPDAALLARCHRAFTDCLLTDFEAQRSDWHHTDDGFDPWLGAYDLRSA